MFDRSYLPPADLEFVVMTDTHYMLDPGAQRVEFESRRSQATRAGHAFEMVRSLETSFVVHLGDLVQEFPESPGFQESLEQALDQMHGAGITPRQVAGNHDVGDKPDPTMPTDWVTRESLKAYHDRFGQSWYSWDESRCHFVVLNSQIMNGPLPEVLEQERWLEADLESHSGMPTFLFLHLAPFLVDEDEQGLGHYDNIDEPARSWLLRLIRSHNVQMVFFGHSHFAFFNRIGETRSYLVPSTAFTRPGFCEVFSSAPPPERGRDDTPKLGFFLVRVKEGKAAVHLIRTSGETALPFGSDATKRIVTRISQDLPSSPLGVTLRHPLAPATEVPIAWQSTVRQPVRNDFPLLACIELGLRHVRIPAADLTNPHQRERLSILRDEGVAITAFWIWSERSRLVEDMHAHSDLLDGVEIQIPGELLPDDRCLEAIQQCSQVMPVTLSPLLPREIVPGKQHARTRIGYHLSELECLDNFLANHGAHVHRVLCRVDVGESPLDAIGSQEIEEKFAGIGAIDWAIEFGDADEKGQIARAVEGIAAIAAHEGSRLFLEPLMDLDRTMDAPPGLIDRLCNPRPVFHAVRTLNTILFSKKNRWTIDAPSRAFGTMSVQLKSPEQHLFICPEDTGSGIKAQTDTSVGAVVDECWSGARLVDLVHGTVRPLAERADIDGPSVVISPASAPATP